MVGRFAERFEGKSRLPWLIGWSSWVLLVSLFYQFIPIRQLARETPGWGWLLPKMILKLPRSWVSAVCCEAHPECGDVFHHRRWVSNIDFEGWAYCLAFISAPQGCQQSLQGTSKHKDIFPDVVIAGWVVFVYRCFPSRFPGCSARSPIGGVEWFVLAKNRKRHGLAPGLTGLIWLHQKNGSVGWVYVFFVNEVCN